MARSAGGFRHRIKDKVRGVRYSIQAEAETPGSAVPQVFKDMGLGPLLAIGSVVGTPALRLADGFFTQVETIATDVLAPPRPDMTAFPYPFGAYVASEAETTRFSDILYEPVKDMLSRHGARRMLVSEQALEAVGAEVRARHGVDLSSVVLGAQRSEASTGDLTRLCASLAYAFAQARPIRKVDFENVDQVRPSFLLSPNLYCGLVIGLATAIVTLDPDLGEDRDAVLASADSATDARFARFRKATTGKAAISNLAREFATILPFLP